MKKANGRFLFFAMLDLEVMYVQSAPVSPAWNYITLKQYETKSLQNNKNVRWWSG